MQKVITPIGVVVEVSDEIYNNNKHIFKKLDDTSVTSDEETEEKTEKTEESKLDDTSVTSDEVKNTAIKKKSK